MHQYSHVDSVCICVCMCERMRVNMCVCICGTCIWTDIPMRATIDYNLWHNKASGEWAWNFF